MSEELNHPFIVELGRSSIRSDWWAGIQQAWPNLRVGPAPAAPTVFYQQHTAVLLTVSGWRDSLLDNAQHSSLFLDIVREAHTKLQQHLLPSKEGQLISKLLQESQRKH